MEAGVGRHERPRASLYRPVREAGQRPHPQAEGRHEHKCRRDLFEQLPTLPIP